MTKKITEEIKYLNVDELKPFEEHPFKVRIDEEMDELVESIKENGLVSPIIARPHKDGGYEIISGHRRVKACEILQLKQAPVIVKDIDDDTAVILVVDSNLNRENILPSEKAFAYQMKLEAIKRKAGRPTKDNVCQIGTDLIGIRSDELVAENTDDSARQVQRYIRLTNLIDPLLTMVDEKQIAMTAAVELSYLGSKEQAQVMDVIDAEATAPSIAQATKIHNFSKEGKLSPAVIESIMQEEKSLKRKVTISEDKINRYFPKNYTKEQIEETVLRLIKGWYKKRHQSHER
ncbi:MAG: ParB/RepB/Spo0J family partition protein [Alphaproteobacteria bacterium]|nr:ParB/RepB/Spo0J family partition protein [Alphaproteobacteria bacterium]